MSKSVDLPDSVFVALEAAATATGLTPAEWVATRLLPPPSPVKASRGVKRSRNQWDEFAGRTGVSSESDDPSDDPDAPRKPRPRRPRTHLATAPVSAVDLPDPVYAVLEDTAIVAGTTPGEWIASTLPGRGPGCEGGSGEGQPRTLADRFEGLLGLVSLDRTDLAERAGELFADGMEAKYRVGRL